MELALAVIALVKATVLSMWHQFAQVIDAVTSQINSDDTAFKLFLEHYGFNLLGDTLSGVFAPVTFVLVLISLFFQRAQMKQSVQDMKTQTDLNRSIAQANYKFSLHEKRLAVYVRLRECAFALSTSGTIEKETRQKIYSTLEDAKFVFGPSVVEYVEVLSTKTDEIMRRKFRSDRLGKKREATGLNEAEETQWNEAIDAENALENWFYENLTWEILADKFKASLTLPETIE